MKLLKVVTVSSNLHNIDNPPSQRQQCQLVNEMLFHMKNDVFGKQDVI